MRYLTIGLLLALLAVPAQAQEINSIAPASEATHTAVQSGTWANVATWGGVSIPQNARVLIPAGITVTVSNVVTTAPFWVRVDGVLRFEPSAIAWLLVETLVVPSGGRVEVGTEADPIYGSAIIMFRALSGQAINHTYDPMELSRGLIADGHVEMWGAPKTPYVTVSTPPAMGSAQVQLDSVPEFWVVGDEVVVTGPGYDGEEARTIADLSGTLLTVSSPLLKPRAFPPGCEGCRLHVANLSRKVTLQSDPAQAGSAQLRGHVMLMHHGGHQIHYARFKDLGRTTTQPVSDPMVVNGVRQSNLMPLCGLTAENVRGRYSLHFHLAGVLSARSEVVGSVVDNAKNSGFKLGFTNHESNVSFRQNVGFQIDGSHFFTEEGTETGEFVENIAIHSRGDQNGGLDHQLSVQGCESNHPNEWHRARLDVGFKGVGFWLHSGATPAVGNIAVGMSDTGINVWPRPLDFGKNNTYHLRIPVEAIGSPSWTGAVPDIEVENVPWTLTDNWAYAIGGLDRYDTATCYENKYTLLHQWQTYPQSPKAIFTNNRGWNCRKGVQTAYAGSIRYRDVWLLQGAAHNPRQAGFGLNLSSQGGNRNELLNVSINGYASDLDICIRPSSFTTYTNVTCDGQPYGSSGGGGTTEPPPGRTR